MTGIVSFVVVLWVIYLMTQFIEPISYFIAGMLKFIKNNWYMFAIIAWFFRG